MAKWMGCCPSCGSWNSLEDVEKTAENNLLEFQNEKSLASLVTEISHETNQRIKTGLSEFDRVLGGGIVPGSLTLVGGDPGVGKSTLLTNVLAELEKKSLLGPLLYISGEESKSQVAARFRRLVPKGRKFWIMHENELEKMFREIDTLRPKMIVLDSIQTTSTKSCSGGAGSASQIKEVTYELMNKLKAQNISCFVIGHITKDGQIAGPKLLEHMVDTVLYFEGQRDSDYRVLRAVKNRFGCAQEVGLFEMKESGLESVHNPMEYFLGGAEHECSGRSLSTLIEGTRTLLIEVQALVLENKFGQGRRVAQGLDSTRLSLLLAVMEKHMNIPLSMNDVFINIVGGLKVHDRGSDLSVIAALCSSIYQVKMNPKWMFMGEVGLNGEVRACPQVEKRLREVQRSGVDKVFLDQKTADKLKDKTRLKLIGLSALGDLKDEMNSNLMS